MKSNLITRVIGKAKRVVREKSQGATIKPAKWILEQSGAFESQAKRSLSIDVISDINTRNAYPQNSIAIELAIDSLLNSGKYNINNMLVIKNPYQYSPLCALGVFNSKEECKVKVKVLGKTEDAVIDYELPYNKNHRVPIMGLYADYDNEVILTLVDKNENVIKTKKIIIPVSPLNGRIPEVKIAKKSTETPYLYDLTLVYGGDDGIYPYAFDRNGDIRFIFAMSPKTYGFQPISKGRFLFLNKKVTRVTATNPASTQMFEVDQMGRFHKIYNVEKGAHHDFVELSNGNLVTAGNTIEGKTYEDTVIEIDRKTGEVVNEIRLKDYIDAKYVDAADWAHLNTIEYNEKDKTVMVSLRNLHAVVKVNYETKELMWILGNPLFWEGSTVADKVLTPVGDIEWFFQAHASYFVEADLDGNPETKHLIIYDNHTHKRRPVSYYDKAKESFVRFYTINEKEMTVSLYKSFACERSSIRSNAVLEHEAGRVMAMSGKLQGLPNGAKSMVKEFDFNTGEVLNEYTTSFGFYRAYEFEFAPEKMSAPMECRNDYALGKVYEMKQIDQPDVSKAKELPQPVLEECDATEEDRKKRLNDIATKNPEAYIDPEQDMARITMNIEEDVLYVTLLDHLLEKIYFVGEKYAYERDFTDTKQERPEYFARAGNTDPIPLKDLEEDKYKIYFKHKIGLYNSDHEIEVRKGG